MASAVAVVLLGVTLVGITLLMLVRARAPSAEEFA